MLQLRHGAIPCLARLVALTVVAAFWATAATAQPNSDVGNLPTYQVVDENGVDRPTGAIVVNSIDLQIGPEDGGMRLSRAFARGVWRHNFQITLSARPTLMTVTIGGIATKYPYCVGTCGSLSWDGSSITSAYPLYTLTMANGTRLIFDTRMKDNGSDLEIIAVATQMTLPSGETLDLSYTSPPCGFAPPCSVFHHRLHSVRSNRGYQFFFEYASQAATTAQITSSWRQVTRVTAINNTEEVCPPSAATCALTGSWRTVDYDLQWAGGQSDMIQTATDSLDRVTQYRFTPFNRLIGIRRPGSTADDVAITWDAAGDRVVTVAREGVTYTYNYADTPGVRTTTRTSSLGHQTILTSDTTTGAKNGRPIGATDELGRMTTFEHDLAGRLTRVTSPDGNSVFYTLDSRGNVTQTRISARPGSGLADITTSATFDPDCTVYVKCNSPNTTTDARSQITEYTYDPTHGGLLTVTAPAPAPGAVRPQMRYAYTPLYARYRNDAGVLVQAATPIHQPTSVSSCRTLASCAATADEVRTTIVYGSPNAANNLLATSATVGSGDGLLTATTSIGYDVNGEIIAVDGPLAGPADTTHFRYDAVGQQVGTILPDPDGPGPLPLLAARNAYDGGGRLERVENGTLSAWQGTAVAPSAWPGFTLSGRLDVTYDPQGRKTGEVLSSATGAMQSVTQFSYDGGGRLECMAVRMNSALFGSLPASACAQAMPAGADGPDRIIRNVYDAAGQRLQLREGAGTADEGTEATWGYNLNGQVTTLIDGNGNRAELRYDGHGRRSCWLFPSPTRPTGFNDSTPALALSTAGAVNGNCAGEGDYEEYGYDPAGNRTSLRKRDGSTLTYQYDNLNRMIAKMVPERAGLDPLHTRDVFYGYDAGNRQTFARFDSPSGQGITNTYDGLGRLSSSTTNMSGAARTLTYQYDAASNRISITHPEGQWFGTLYDTAGRPFYLNANPDGSAGIAFAQYAPHGALDFQMRLGAASGIAFDALLRPISLTHLFAGGAGNGNWSYGYNQAGQLSSIVRTDAYAYAGDYNVDRPHMANGLNQYTSAGPATFTYDANGNLVSETAPVTGTRIYAYDVENRLVSATGLPTSALHYDPLGRLFQVSSVNGTTQFLHDGDALVAEYDGSGNLLRRHVHWPGADAPMATYEGSNLATMRQLFSDHQGSIVAIANGDGANLAINRYDEYGIPAATNQGRFQYTGQIWLPEIGMYYYKSRFYSPTLGRFPQADPIGYGGGMNLYAYVGNDPVNYRDPSGLFPCPGGGTSSNCGALGSVTDGIQNQVTPGPDPNDNIVVTGWRLGSIGNIAIVYDIYPQEQIIYAYRNGTFQETRTETVTNTVCGRETSEQRAITNPDQNRILAFLIHVHQGSGDETDSQSHHPFPGPGDGVIVVVRNITNYQLSRRGATAIRPSSGANAVTIDPLTPNTYGEGGFPAEAHRSLIRNANAVRAARAAGRPSRTCR